MLPIMITKTTRPKPKPDPSRLTFGRSFTDHMFILNYDDGQGWHDARIVPYEPLAIDPSAMVFHYAQSVFEGLKCYRATDGRLLLFRPQMNFKRLNASSDRLCIPPLDEDFALRALCELITVDADWAPGEPDTSLYVRPFIIATEPALGVHPAHNYLFMIILSPVGPYYKEGLNPVKIVIEDEYVRAVRGGIGFTKGSANYAASLKGQEKAEANGFTQVLWLDGIERKYIEEVGTMNVFFLINGEVVTPELTGSILPGITRDSVISLLKHWGITVTQRRISAAEIIAASENGSLQEAFGSGTAAVISPIGSLSRGGTTVEIAEGKTGTLSRRLYEQLTGIQYGKSDDPFGWSYDVTSYDVTSGAVKS